MKPLVCYNSKWLNWINKWPSAITLYPVILFKWERQYVWPRLFRHELQHFYQGEKYGFLKFYFYFLRSAFIHGWKDNHPMEKGAENNEQIELTPQEQEWYKGPESKIAKTVDWAFVVVFLAAAATFLYSVVMFFRENYQ